MPKEAKVKSAAAVKPKKAKKDKDAPKRPLSAYMFFSQDHREKVRTDNPDASFGEIGRMLGAAWKEMSDSDKKPYQDMAERDKTRASTEKAAYVKAGGGSSTAAPKKKSSSKKAAPVEEEEDDESE